MGSGGCFFLFFAYVIGNWWKFERDIVIVWHIWLICWFGWFDSWLDLLGRGSCVSCSTTVLPSYFISILSIRLAFVFNLKVLFAWRTTTHFDYFKIYRIRESYPDKYCIMSCNKFTPLLFRDLCHQNLYKLGKISIDKNLKAVPISRKAKHNKLSNAYSYIILVLRGSSECWVKIKIWS